MKLNDIVQEIVREAAEAGGRYPAAFYIPASKLQGRDLIDSFVTYASPNGNKTDWWNNDLELVRSGVTVCGVPIKVRMDA